MNGMLASGRMPTTDYAKAAADQYAYLQQETAAYGSGEGLKPTIFSAAVQFLSVQAKMLEEAASQVEAFLARIYGPQPANKQDGPQAPQPSGLFSELERALERNERLIRELLVQVQRLHEIG